MSDPIVILDPTAEADPQPATPARRLESLTDLTIGLLWNGKPAGAPFFEHLEALVRKEWTPRAIVRLTKGNYSAPAEPDLVRELSRCHLIVTGVGD